jgi:hypothetical protein
LEIGWIAIFFLATSWIVPPLGDGWFTTAEKFFSRLAARRSACILILFFATILIRVALLPVFPYPRPFVHDEFSYLLQADIFAHGHLAFPPHPMARYFDTFYVNFHPTYSSMYPPAQAATLAIGQLLGNPWIGVLLSTAAMVAAMLWMLQGWFPPRWALLGASLVLMRFAVFSYWMNSYWGGSVAAIGAALVFGALPRLRRYSHARDAFLLGTGVFILANSRPLEGFIFCVPVALALLFWLLRRHKKGLQIPIRRVLLPIFGCIICTIMFALYFNWRLTGSPLEFSRMAYYGRYFTVSPVVWGTIRPPIHYANPQFEQFFNGWLRSQYDGTWHDLKRIEIIRTRLFWQFFLGPLLSIPMLSLPSLLKDRFARPFLLQFIVCILGLLAVTWFLPHYASPAFCVLFVILVQAFRHIRKWKLLGRPVGITWTRLIVALTLASVPLCIAEVVRHPMEEICLSYGSDSARAHVVSKLESIVGNHLVIVRYSRSHDAHKEWVYNAADIDHSRIVWAREIPGTDLSPLFAYYSGRKVWIAEPDANPPLIYSYSDKLESQIR